MDSPLTPMSTVTDDSFPSVPGMVEEIYRDFCGRRSAVVRALTADVDEFCGLCDPEKDSLCLYGYPNGSWEVAPPEDELPPDLPEPTLGINFSRDGTLRRDWLTLVAIHSDSWLLSVAFFLGSSLNANERKHLFSLITDHPTVLEAMSDHENGRDDEAGVVIDGSKPVHIAKKGDDPPTKNIRPVAVDEEHSETLCGICGGRYNSDEFRIGCDSCERWFHAKCVRISPAKAEQIMHYKCPECSSSKKSWQ
ncbi:hypothetical protein GUJ93_ZPchr0013g35861 [Zizania palustris]|uniref:PHD finger protein ALFIN-LIKE n=1 Tax=Zizania palustris TaxID=103762 RepID=A0A8J6BYG3_ZIZPA|nr:hypothetical protein GUJ93_ZPchr0013g35861 [Zizania palustris]